MPHAKKPKFDPNKHHRKSIRLQNYDYSQAGAYFVTIVAYQRKCLFGDIVTGQMVLNGVGQIADACWQAIPEHFPHVDLGTHIVMPNHVHGIIIINNLDNVVNTRTKQAVPQQTKKPHARGVRSGSLGAIVGSFKAAVTKRIRREHNLSGIWQRNYYDRVIRNEQEMHDIWRYIESNPARWQDDTENPHSHRL